MIKVDVTLDSDLLQTIQSQFSQFTGKKSGKIAPATKNSFDMASKVIQKSWKNWAIGGSIEGIDNIKSPSTRLSSSIKIKRSSDFDANIGTESMAMERIQTGTPEIDMKETYPYGTKSRMSKKNVPYLIIPLRWGTPNKKGGVRAHFGVGNTIPPDVAKFIQARSFKKSYKTGETHLEDNAKGESIRRQEYNWGDRLEDSGNMNGMVKMASNNKSTYFTFRIISANSPAGTWIKKAVPAIDVVNAVEKTTRPIVEKLLDAGIRQDLGID